MRATLFILLGFVILSLFLWISLSGALFGFGFIILLGLVIVTLGYQDTFILFLLGARELRASDEKAYFEAASQESYKLSVDMPRLYFYDGTLERGFILQVRKSVSIILNKDLIEHSTSEELKAICFELLLQVKKGMAPKRTKSMFALGLITFFVRSFMSLIFALIPFEVFKRTMNLFASYFLHPLFQFLFKVLVGKGYYKKLIQFIGEFPEEKSMLERLGQKFRKQSNYYSLSSRKILELSSVHKSPHYQNITLFEFLPHEWDYIFMHGELTRAE